MTAIKTIDPAVKLNLAIESLMKPQLKAKELAEQFGMSETTAKRAMKEFHDEACKIIDERIAAEEAALQAADDAAKAAAATPGKKSSSKKAADAKAPEAPKTDDAPKVDDAPVTPPAAPAPAAPKARALGTDIPRGEKGFKARNGRWTVLNALFAEKGFDDAAALYIEANVRGTAAGLKELNRGSFYSMLSMAKKKSLTAAQTAASVKDVSKDDKTADTSTDATDTTGATDTAKS